MSETEGKRPPSAPDAPAPSSGGDSRVVQRPAVPRPASSAKLPAAPQVRPATLGASMATTPMAFTPLDIAQSRRDAPDPRGPDAPTLTPPGVERIGPRAPAAGAPATSHAPAPSSAGIPAAPDSARDLGKNEPLVVGRYAVFQQLAAGGMATVHFGRLLGAAGFARTVAIKRLHSHYAKDEDFCAMFLDEARIVARIRHPNVVQMVDVVQSSTAGLFLIMEYVHGEPLSKLVRTAAAQGERLPVDVCATIASDVLHGLHAAHETTGEDGSQLNVVHRDVSPQNIIVGVDGAARVLDFGIAKAAGRAAVTREGQIKGKLTYMAPEQVRGNVDRRADVFAAGVVLWEMLAGRRMHEGLGDGEMLSRVIKGEFSPPSEHNAEVSPELDALVLRALSNDVNVRFATAREMARELEQLVPRAGPSDIGAWVERLASTQLAARAAVISAMEQASDRLRPHDSIPPAPTDFTLSEAIDIPIDFDGAGPSSGRPRPAPVPPPAVALPPAPRQPSDPGDVAPEPANDLRANIILAVAAAAVTALIAGAALAVYSMVTSDTRSPAPDVAPSAPALSAPAPTTLSPSSAPAGSAAPVPVPPPTAAVPSVEPAESASASAAPASAPPASASSPASATAAAPARSASVPAIAPPKKAAPSCDPPYTVDDVGHRHYKPECL